MIEIMQLASTVILVLATTTAAVLVAYLVRITARLEQRLSTASDDSQAGQGDRSRG